MIPSVDLKRVKTSISICSICDQDRIGKTWEIANYPPPLMKISSTIEYDLRWHSEMFNKDLQRLKIKERRERKVKCQ